MQSRIYNKGIYTVIELRGELDESCAAGVRRQLDEELAGKQVANNVLFDMRGVPFMDSTGIGFLMGRYKKLSRYGIGMAIEAPDRNADKILSMSGIYTLVPKI